MPDTALMSTREAYGDALLELGGENKDIVALSADLSESTKTHKFAEKFPDRFIQAGVAEQNMAGIAAGLAASGKIPFMASYSVFSPGRNWEQIRLAICYSDNNVKILGSHSGLSASADGATHQALEDIAITRCLPNMTVIAPIDYYQAFAATKAAAQHIGPTYIRVIREKSHVITKKSDKFEIGKAYELRKGAEVVIFVTGTIAAEAIQAAHLLKNISCGVVAVPTVKPLDTKAILEYSKGVKVVVTVEEHQVNGGFGGTIAEFLIQHNPVPVKIIGVQDAFGQSGTYDELKALHKLDPQGIAEQIEEFYKKWN